jgi:PEGA domain
MKPLGSAHIFAAAAVVAACMVAMPPALVAGQQDRASAGSGGGGASAGGGGGGTMSAGGGADRSSGGGGGGGFSGSGGSDSGGNRAGATGSSGVAMPRGGGDHGYGGASPRSVGSGGSAGTRATGRTQEDPGDRSGVPPYSRPRDPNEPTQGTAVPRPPNSRPGAGTGGPTYIVPGGYYGGLGYGYPYGGGYYGAGYYDPWYDPWYGSYPGYGGGGYSQSSFSDEGSLRLKIKPRDAEVYVDGLFVGIVDEFDGTFQRLHIDSGVHRIEVRAAGYETLIFDVRIVPDRKTTYQGELHRIQ